MNVEVDKLFDSWPTQSNTSEIDKLRAEFRLERCPIRPFSYQVVGVERVVSNPFFALFDTMGLGKTLQTIIAAQVLFQMGAIDRVIVIAPATIRSVWFDQELGELAKHLFVPSLVSEFHAKIRQWRYGISDDSKRLKWIITNYDFIRSDERVAYLQRYCTQRTLLAIDESSAIKNRTAQQTKACFKLRAHCGRVVELNGTPVSQSPLDLFTQGNILDSRILQCKSYYEFRSRYAVMRPNSSFPQIVGWQNLEDLQRRFKPFVLRRMKDQQDLPPKLPAVVREVRLTKPTWTKYKAMRDDMVTWVDKQHVVIAQQAVVKIMRLLQLTSGFVGGVEVEEPIELPMEEGDLPEWFDATDAPRLVEPELALVDRRTAVAEVSREKLDHLLAFLRELFDEDARRKIIVWSRFRPEYARTIAELARVFPALAIEGITGGQKKADRARAVRLLDPRTAPTGGGVVVMTAGHKGLNLTAASVNIYLSHDPSADKRLQSEDRTHRQGQVQAVSYFDIVAYGPEGQKTWDHTTIKNRNANIDLGNWTAAEWKSALLTE